MKIKKMLVAGATVLLLAGTVTGVALASNKAKVAHKPAAAEVTTAPDTDNIQLQQGDQTSPDATSPAANETAGNGESTGGGENSGVSDGPGGHADPAGNVDHQYQGEE